MIEIHRRDLIARACSLATAALGSATTPPEPRKRKLVVAGGHPGDPEYGCGGTIARWTDDGN